MVAVDLFSYADDAPEGGSGRLYRDLVEQAVTADALGYGRFWVTEQHLTAAGHVPDTLQLLAYIAARTERLGLATGVTPAAVHEPVLLLESILQLAVLSGDRLDLGIGSGSEAGSILEVLSRTPADAAARTDALYALMDQVRPGASVTVRSGDRELDVALDPPPSQPLLERVWTAAGRSALALTARYRTGLLLPRPMPRPARLELAAAYRAAVPGGRVVHFKAGLVGPSAEEARRRATGFVQRYARRYLDADVGGADTAAFRDALDRLDFAVGAAEQVADRMRDWLEGFGDEDTIAIQFGGPAVRQEDVLASLELFAPQVAAFAAERENGAEASDGER